MSGEERIKQQIYIEDSRVLQKKQHKVAKALQIMISTFFILLGIGVLASQGGPLLISYVNGKILEKQTSDIATPLPESFKQYIEGEFAYYDPGQSYFENLIGSISQSSLTNLQNGNLNVVVDTTYDRPMYLSIPDIAINNILVSPNVESYDAEVYNAYLKKGLAHFKGTPIPGDGGNAFIYGHSAVESFFSTHKNLPETIFSKLENAEVGQKVYIEKDGEILTYVIRRKLIIEPTDFSFLESQSNKETITLMTCWPLGIGTKRLIVIADRI